MDSKIISEHINLSIRYLILFYVFSRSADIFYIPTKAKKQYTVLSKFFSQGKIAVGHEIFVPILEHCLQPDIQITKLTCINDMPHRPKFAADPWQVMEKEVLPQKIVYVHPLKFSNLANPKDNHKFYCEHVLPLFLQH